MPPKAIDHKHSLTAKDHQALTKLLEDVLDAYKEDKISRQQATIGLQHMFAAVDKATQSQIQGWIHQTDLKFFHEQSA